MAGGEPLAPPAAPSGLVADPVSDSEVSLSWVDNSDNESVFEIERNNQLLSHTASANQTAYTDKGLDSGSTYTYRVRARNAAGESDWSLADDAITDAPPPYQTVYVSSESTLAGSVVSGSLTDTQAAGDELLEVISEQESGGRPSLRHSYLDHRWSLSVPAGLVSLSVTGWTDGSSDGDDFEIAYSTGGEFTTVCTLAVGSASECTVAFDLASSATVTVRLTDTDQLEGSRSLDRVNIDQIVAFAESNGGSVIAPTAPTGLQGDNSTPGIIALTWVDAANESTYEVRRFDRLNEECVNKTVIAVLPQDTQSHSDETVTSMTSYCYQVSAVNAIGAADSGTVVVTSAEQPSPELTLTATGYKTKGLQNVNLEWQGAEGAEVTVYRDGTDVYSGAEASTTDRNIAKGGATYEYQVCPGNDAAGSNSCSNVATVVF